MEKADISETHFSIQNVRTVIRAENKMHNKKNFVNGRPCDVFVYIISGKCEYACDDGTEFTVNSGDVMFLAKGGNSKKLRFSIEEALLERGTSEQ